VDLWFDYPTHHVDVGGLLKDQVSEGDKPPWQKNFPKKKTPDQVKKDRNISIETAYEACDLGGKITVQDLMDYTGKSEDTVRRHLKQHGGFWIDKGEVGRKPQTQSREK
jgi:hypothetical protein